MRVYSGGWVRRQRFAHGLITCWFLAGSSLQVSNRQPIASTCVECSRDATAALCHSLHANTTSDCCTTVLNQRRLLHRGSSDNAPTQVPLEDMEIIPPPPSSSSSSSFFPEISYQQQSLVSSSSSLSPSPPSLSSLGGGQDADLEVVEEVDPFARAKVANFLKRISGSNMSTSVSAATTMEMREVQGSSSTGQQGSLFHARQRLCLPSEYGERYAEGFAPTTKEAEAVAWMHAERLIDAVGLPIFQLSSKQARHAAAAKAAGRWAPLPAAEAQREGKEPALYLPRPSAPSPPPLHLSDKSEAAAAAVLHARSPMVMMASPSARVPTGNAGNISFTTSFVGSSSVLSECTIVQRGGTSVAPLEHTLASLYFIDDGSNARLRNFFSAYHVDMRRYLHIVSLHDEYNKSRTGGTNRAAAAAAGRVGRDRRPPARGFLAQLKLPISERFGERVCVGIAEAKKDAVSLACMHAELLIDALGLALYPGSRELQAAHAAECRQVGRCCAEPGDCEYNYDLKTPPPLRLVEGTANASVPSSNSHASVHSSGEWVDSQGGLTTPHDRLLGKTAEVGVEAASVESLLVQHGHAVNEMYEIADVAVSEPEARAQLLRYLQEVSGKEKLTARGNGGRESVSPFFVETLGIKGQETYRATVTVPLLQNAIYDNNEASCHSSPSHSRLASQFVAVGIAATKVGAEVAAAMHAVRCLGALGRRLSSTSATDADGEDAVGWKYPENLSETVWPPPVRYLGSSHVGRIVVSGLRTGEKGKRGTVVGLMNSDNASHFLADEAQWQQDIMKARATLPMEQWSLHQDGQASEGGDRIIVDPDANPTMSRNYVHTLPSVRTPDVFAVNRLRDYLERHGKRLEACVEKSVISLDDSEGTTREAVSSSTMSDQHNGDAEMQLHIAIVLLPIPVRSSIITSDSAATTAPTLPAARFYARGEAYTESDALLMCAVHAELLLDSLGVPLYDHAVLQRKHADTARMLGRWASRAGVALAPDAFAEVPPPVRKERHDSPLWARLVKERAAGSVVKASQSLEVCVSRKESSNRNKDSSATMSSTECEKICGTMAAPSESGKVSSDTPVDGAVDEDALCELAQLQHMYFTAAYRRAIKHAIFYFRSRGSDFYRTVHQYTVMTPAYGGVHRCIVAIPLPLQFSGCVRYGVACASDKKEALALCALHVLAVLDALHVRIYVGRLKLEEEYKQFVSSVCDRTLVTSTLAPPSTPSPPGYSCVEGDLTLAAPTPPVVPTRDTLLEIQRHHKRGEKDSMMQQHKQQQGQGQPHRKRGEERNSADVAWEKYAHACRQYCRRMAAYRLQCAALIDRQAPRSGIRLEDEGLDVVERIAIDRTARAGLAALCKAAWLPVPPTGHLRFEAYGREPAGTRAYIATGEVLGTPYVARGFSTESGLASVARASMHYAYIVTRTSSSAAASQRRGHGSRSGRPTRGTSGNGRHEGKGRSLDRTALRVAAEEAGAVIAIYAATHAPYQSPQVQVQRQTHERKEGTSPSQDNVETTYVASVELVDGASSLTHRSKGKYTKAQDEDDAKAVTCAVEQATLELLQRHLHKQSDCQYISRFVACRRSQLRLDALTILDPSAIDGADARSFSSFSPLSSLSTLPLDERVAKLLALVPPAALPTADAVMEELRSVPPLSLDKLGNFNAQVLLWRGLSGTAHQHTPLAALLEAAAQGLGQGCAPAPLQPVVSATVRAQLQLMGLVYARAKDTTDCKSGAQVVTPQGSAVALLLRCFPPVAEAACTEARGLLLLQLGKLLLAGHLLGCVSETVQIAAMIMTSSQREAQDAALHLSPTCVDAATAIDVVEVVVLRGLHEDGLNYARKIEENLTELSHLLRERAPDTALTALFAPHHLQSPPPPPVSSSASPSRLGSEDGGAQLLLRARLQQCVAFATFPGVLTAVTSYSPSYPSWMPSPVQALSHGRGGGGEEEGGSTQDGTHSNVDTTTMPMMFARHSGGDASGDAYRVTLKVPISHMQLEPAIQCDDIDSVPEQWRCSCRLPCFAVFDTATASGNNNSGASVRKGEWQCPVFGALVPPAASLLSSVAGSNLSEVLAGEADVGGLALFYSGTVPLALHGCSNDALLGLQGSIAQYVSLLRPLPSSIQAALDEVTLAPCHAFPLLV